ncbi:ATP-binding cassette domain-containing protein, partial [bacterium]|nr:ATP-binding cassette domain-containing protein [bacterium]
MSDLLAAEGLTKRFDGAAAVDGVDLDVRAGEIHAVLGENGAGKTTLLRLLFGTLRPDAGTIRWRGTPVTLDSPKDAHALGIGMVHQHFMLVDALTVWENLWLAHPARPGLRLDARAARRAVRELSERFALDLDPDARVADLPVGVRQRLEIAKALTRRTDLLILDEPTAVLTPPEIDALFAVMTELRAAGSAVLFISHKLREVLRISDRITVLRRGRV